MSDLKVQASLLLTPSELEELQAWAKARGIKVAVQDMPIAGKTLATRKATNQLQNFGYVFGQYKHKSNYLDAVVRHVETFALVVLQEPEGNFTCVKYLWEKFWHRLTDMEGKPPFWRTVSWIMEDSNLKWGDSLYAKSYGEAAEWIGWNWREDEHPQNQP